jgi:hypothetical protein
MLNSFLGVLVPRIFESNAGSLQQSTGGSIAICRACISQFKQIFTKLPGTNSFRIADCGLSGEGNCGMRKDNRIKAIFSRRARRDRREKRMPGGLPRNQRGFCRVPLWWMAAHRMGNHRTLRVITTCYQKYPRPEQFGLYMLGGRLAILEFIPYFHNSAQPQPTEIIKV